MGVLRWVVGILFSRLMGYLSITEILGIGVEQCSCQAWRARHILAGGGAVGSKVLDLGAKWGKYRPLIHEKAGVQPRLEHPLCIIESA